MNEINRLRNENQELKKQLEQADKAYRKLQDRMKNLEVNIRKNKKVSRKIKTRLESADLQIIELFDEEMERSLNDLQEIISEDTKPDTVEVDNQTFLAKLKHDCLNPTPASPEEFVTLNGKKVRAVPKLQYGTKK